MFKGGFSSFSTNDLEKTWEFYGQTLGLPIKKDDKMGILQMDLPDAGRVMIYPKDDHQPATFTVLNLIVDDVEKAVDDLTAKGIEVEKYDKPNIKTDDKGIAGGGDQGPKIAWFKYPAGNILAVIEES